MKNAQNPEKGLKNTTNTRFTEKRPNTKMFETMRLRTLFCTNNTITNKYKQYGMQQASSLD